MADNTIMMASLLFTRMSLPDKICSWTLIQNYFPNKRKNDHKMSFHKIKLLRICELKKNYPSSWKFSEIVYLYNVSHL